MHQVYSYLGTLDSLESIPDDEICATSIVSVQVGHKYCLSTLCILMRFPYNMQLYFIMLDNKTAKGQANTISCLLFNVKLVK